MGDMATAAAGLALVIWMVLLFARGGFWRADQRLPPATTTAGSGAEGASPAVVVAVVPARDEEATIGNTLASLLAQSHGVQSHGAPGHGALTVVLVDDHSSDRTRAIAGNLAGGCGGRLHVVAGEALPPGWSGKLWAVAQGIAAAGQLVPGATHILLTDADIALAPATLSRLLALAENRRLDLVSLMVELDHRGLWGRLLIPAFVFFFQKLYPFAWVNAPHSRTAAAAGGCVLLRRAALERAGGIAAIRGALIDDCALAAIIKGTGRGRAKDGGGAIWLGLADASEARSLRDNRDLSGIWHMVARTAYTQLHHSPLLLAGTLAGMVLTYLVAPLAVLAWPLHGSAPAALAGALTWLLMVVAYRPTLRLYGQPVLAGIALPVAGALYGLMTLDSAWRYWRGRGGQWKGRVYPAPEPALRPGPQPAPQPDAGVNTAGG